MTRDYCQSLIFLFAMAVSSVGFAQTDFDDLEIPPPPDLPDIIAPTPGFETAPAESSDKVDASGASKELRLRENREMLVEDFTGHNLIQKEWKLGTEVQFGITDRFSAGADLLAAMVGAPTVLAKYKIYDSAPHSVALGIRAAFIDRETALWGSLKDHFDELNVRFARPSVSWTNRLSSRLYLHTYFAQGFGTLDLELSQEGRCKLWEAKHPGSDCRFRTTESSSEEEGEEATSTTNQERVTSNRSDSYAQRTVQVSSITGILADVFQMSGEIRREGGNKVLVTSRIERLVIETLKANNIRFTVSQQWIWDNFQIRLGLGVQYAVISGRDLDREAIDEAGVLPASDFQFYWRF